MKKIIFLLIAGLFVTACTHNHSHEESPTPKDKVSAEITPSGSGVELGGVCGGPDKKACGNNYLCEFNVGSPDATGTCVDTVADKNIVCEELHDPVCGDRNGQLHGFQNECQVERHGASVVGKGFCQVDSAVQGSCEATAIGIGTCFDTFTGYEFDGENCVERFVSGCEGQIPFSSLEACTNKCL